MAPPELPGRAALAPWGEEAAQASVAPARRALAALERRGALPQAWAVQARQLGEEEAAPAWGWGTPASAQVPEAWAAPAPWGARGGSSGFGSSGVAGCGYSSLGAASSSSRAAPLMLLHESSSAMRRTRESIMDLWCSWALGRAMDDTCCSVVCLCASCDRVESQ